MIFQSHKRQFALLIAGVFFMFAPRWVPHVQTVAGRSLFVTVDSMALLGVTLLVSLLAVYLLPNFVVMGFRKRVPSPASQGAAFKPMAHGPWFVVGLLSLVGLAYILYLVNQHILHSFLSSADEHSCYFLAECLRRGKLYVDLPPLADFFKVVHVGMRGGKWFSVYPPGWPLIWAIGLKWNIADWLNPVMTSLAVFFFYLAGIRLFSRLAVAGGLVVMCLSPFFMFTAASYFSHATCLLTISVFLYAFLRWHEAYEAGRDPVGWAALCAFAFGYGLMTRYLTMAAIAGPFLLNHFLRIFFEWKGWKRGALLNIRLSVPMISLKRPRLRKSDWIVIGVAGAFMLLILWQNYLVTGKPFKAPNKYDKSWERLGFRRDFTPIDAFFFVIARIVYLMDWFAPALVGVYLLAFWRKDPDAAAGRKKNLRGLFRYGMVFIAAAYFFYYSWGGNQWGPRYLWEGMPFLSIAVADWLARLWREGGVRVKKFLLMFMIASIATSGVLFAKHAVFTEEASRQRRALYDLAERTIRGPAIVFIHGFLGDRLVLAEEDAVRNTPFLDARILYAHDLAGQNSQLMAQYKDRKYYRGGYDRKSHQPYLEQLFL